MFWKASEIQKFESLLGDGMVVHAGERASCRAMPAPALVPILVHTNPPMLISLTIYTFSQGASNP